MKKNLVLVLLVFGAAALLADDLRLNNEKGTVLKDFSGLGGVAPVPRSKTNAWGIIVFYENGTKKAVVQVSEFPKDFPYMAQVRKRAELIPEARAKASADAKEQQQEVKEELERQKRLKKIAADAKKAEKEDAASGKKKAVKGKKKTWKK
ncbi:MAG: hypothetical protein J6331_08875 [Lentisphaeria bacterium]|nr:hypothetical protein [Lentisphaeria bacterium]